MEALINNCRYHIRSFTKLRRLEREEVEFSLSEIKESWQKILHGAPLQLVIIERKKIDDEIVDTIIDGQEFLVYAQTTENEGGYIDFETLEYNVDGQGFPLHLQHNTREFMHWLRDISEFDWDHPDLIRAEEIRNYLTDIQVPTATVLR